MTVMFFKIASGIWGVVPFLIWMVASFVIPDFVTRENHEIVIPVLNQISDVIVYVLFFSNMSFFFFAIFSRVLPKDKKALWIALLFFGNVLVIPFFWYHYIWNCGDRKFANTSP